MATRRPAHLVRRAFEVSDTGPQAEFVDQTEVLARRRVIGVDYAQGFLLHRREPIDALLELQAS